MRLESTLAGASDALLTGLNECALAGVSNATGSLLGGAILLELLHGLACLLFVTSQLFDSLALSDCESTHETLVSLNVMNVQVDLLLKHDKFMLHLDLEVVAGCLNLSLHLNHLFFLLETDIVKSSFHNLLLTWSARSFFLWFSAFFCLRASTRSASLTSKALSSFL